MVSNFNNINKRKLNYAEKLNSLLDEHVKIVTVGVNNVGSKTLANERQNLRGQNVTLLKGKNTLTRKVLTLRADTMDARWNGYEAKRMREIIDVVNGNIAFMFIPKDENIPKLCTDLTSKKVHTVAKAGAVAPIDVYVKGGPTGLGPEHTLFFQTMDIPTEIKNGQINIKYPMKVVSEGEFVSRSAAELLQMLKMKPFEYGITVDQVVDNGSVFPARMYDDVRQGIHDAYANVLALGLGLGASYTWPHLEQIKIILDDPTLYGVQRDHRDDQIVVSSDDLDDTDVISSDIDVPGIFDDSDTTDSDDDTDSEDSS